MFGINGSIASPSYKRSRNPFKHFEQNIDQFAPTEPYGIFNMLPTTGELEDYFERTDRKAARKKHLDTPIPTIQVIEPPAEESSLQNQGFELESGSNSPFSSVPPSRSLSPTSSTSSRKRRSESPDPTNNKRSRPNSPVLNPNEDKEYVQFQKYFKGLGTDFCTNLLKTGISHLPEKAQMALRSVHGQPPQISTIATSTVSSASTPAQRARSLSPLPSKKARPQYSQEDILAFIRDVEANPLLPISDVVNLHNTTTRKGKEPIKPGTASQWPQRYKLKWFPWQNK